MKNIVEVEHYKTIDGKNAIRVLRNGNFYKNLINELEKKQKKIEGHKILSLSIEEYDDLNAEIDALLYHIFLIDSNDDLNKEISNFQNENPDMNFYESIEPRCMGDEYIKPLN
ncbi:hypothetical protein DBR07_08640 [Aeromonas sp. HMWF036]|uniref:hypothetical protein n=1 Tax=Aeromonas sp. HMWF036 TaxID=2056869 RepID=UPI000D3B2BA7|nr:hypothetical protein [Aeromonas sp. HMWF036]PTS78043.1 hypothetical protein DBR07_08640 [Aeromonas sp. HMWF036]